MAMIEIKNVSKWYGSFQVLKNCSTSVEKGEVVVVCGQQHSQLFRPDGIYHHQ